MTARGKLVEAMSYKMCGDGEACGWCRSQAEDALYAIAEQGYAVVPMFGDKTQLAWLAAADIARPAPQQEPAS